MKNRLYSTSVLISLILVLMALCAPAVLVAQKPDVEKKVEELLAKMTLEEKIGQLVQYSNFGNPTSFRDGIVAGKIGSLLNVTGARQANLVQRMAVEQSRLKIPLILGLDVIHGYRTIFPIPLGEAATWDPALVEQSATVAAREAAAAGVRWTFAPMVDIARDPRWGRIAEGSGEDPYLGAAMARARVRGFQGNDYSDPSRLVACVKHYVAYGAAEGGRDYNTVDVSERRLREVYLPPFKAAVDAGAGTLMSSFNDLNGIPATANRHTLTEILRGEWGFKGFVVSDWASVQELMVHGVAATRADAARQAITAGTDMDMVAGIYADSLAQLVKGKQVPEQVLNEAVRRVLRVKFALGLFDHPYADESREQAAMLTKENLDAARRVAQNSIVLLKNEKDLLPLDKNAGTIAVIGPLADSKQDMLGCWSARGEAKDAVTVLEGIRAKAPGAKVLYAKGVDIVKPSTDGIAEAVNVAKQAKIAVLVVGEQGDMSGEARSRAYLDLPGKQQQLVEAVEQAGVPVVMVLMSGRPLVIGWAAEKVPAILEAWFGGVQAGNAIADVLFGDVNPSGKLPVSFPRTLGQVPIYYAVESTGRPANPKDPFTSRYIDAPNTPLYPFGYGLSYTQFKLSNLSIVSDRVPASGEVKVSVDIENTGRRAGNEVVQVYVRDLVASMTRPLKELKAFQKVPVAPGQKRRLDFTIPARELGLYNREMKYVVEPGQFLLWVGQDSTSGLEGKFQIVQ